VEGERHLVGEAIGAMSVSWPPAAHEARAIVARSVDRLAKLDRVLGLEMAAVKSSVPANGMKATWPFL